MADISAKKRIWGWWWFDWASQPYHTLLVTFVFGPFFAVAAAAFFIGTGLDEKTADAEAQALWSWANTLAGLVIALGGPISPVATMPRIDAASRMIADVFFGATAGCA